MLIQVDPPNLPVPPSPVCDRCHNLLHHHSGLSIDHPSLQSIKDTIFESPHKHNHIYHIIDAADFPLSVIPNLHRSLVLNPQRSRNRRAKTGKFTQGRRADLSFVITRSDLLASKKEVVDSMMPYLLQVLRDTLGLAGRDVRLGNVRCVSSQRGWWTKEIKEDIWRRGGASWLVGKVNVGKSNLFESVFPKGRNESRKPGNSQVDTGITRHNAIPNPNGTEPSKLVDAEERGRRLDTLESDEPVGIVSLLPPSPLEIAYPAMPLVSSLPGTTASPIRLPFGNGKGELIDLPGLTRGNLDTFVQEKHKMDLVMRTKVNPEQQVVKPGQSLLLGGLIRITPINQDIVFLAYPFVPLEAHVTSTEKARGIQTQLRGSGVKVIQNPDAGSKMASAGLFPLRWDVTKQHSGPLTAPAAVGLRAERLPYKVLSTDILIEGCGWVELVAQVRKRQQARSAVSSTLSMGVLGGEPVAGLLGEQHLDPVVEVEVFSPEGKHIGSRRPLNAWRFSAENKSASKKGKGRPRPSMKGRKKAIRSAQSRP